MNPPDTETRGLPTQSAASLSRTPAWLSRLLRVAASGIAALFCGLLALLLVIAVALAVAYPNLPDISSLVDYRPKLPLRILSSDGILLGELRFNRAPLNFRV